MHVVIARQHPAGNPGQGSHGPDGYLPLFLLVVAVYQVAGMDKITQVQPFLLIP